MGQQRSCFGRVGTGNPTELSIDEAGSEDGGHVHVSEVCSTVRHYDYGDRGRSDRVHMEGHPKRRLEDAWLV